MYSNIKQEEHETTDQLDQCIKDVVELPQQQPLMRSKTSNSRQLMAIEPRVAQVRLSANAAHVTHPENAQHEAQNVTSVEIKIILVHVVV